MIIGIKNVLPSLPIKSFAIKRILPFFTCCALFGQRDFDLDFKSPEFSITPKIFHHPNRVLFNSRQFELEVFIDFPKTDLKSISLFFKTDKTKRLVEIPFDINGDRYLFTYDPKEKPTAQIAYFFVVTLNNGSAYATPVDSTGMLMPVVQKLLNPVEYYKQRAAYRN